jgi:phosphoglycerate dehydrogenase-like enzyme
LSPFEAICVMRERTPLSRQIIERLHRFDRTAQRLDRQGGTEERGIRIAHTGYRSTPTVEIVWALILASQQHLVQESNSLRSGGWQLGVGREIAGRTVGVVGLGNIGKQVARIGLVFGMKIIAWSQNTTVEAAQSAGATLVPRLRP